jgi:hypothetical protein
VARALARSLATAVAAAWRWWQHSGGGSGSMGTVAVAAAAAWWRRRQGGGGLVIVGLSMDAVIDAQVDKTDKSKSRHRVFWREQKNQPDRPYC